jgi:uncharacterized membrane protein
MNKALKVILIIIFIAIEFACGVNIMHFTFGYKIITAILMLLLFIPLIVLFKYFKQTEAEKDFFKK